MVEIRQTRPSDQLPEGATSPDAKPVVQMRPRARTKAPVHLADLSYEQRREAFHNAGLPAFRADQVSRHYFGKYSSDLSQLPQLGEKAAVYAQQLLPELVRPVTQIQADGGETIKSLWELYDGAQVEAVLMRYPQRTTLCVSSEVGCGMGCPFCATGQMGLTRNLSAAEIVEQVRKAHEMCAAGALAGGPTTLHNIVFMGMGEPLANFKAVATALERLTSPVPEGFGMSARAITVSTVGLIPGITKLAELGLPVRLAVSLHAPDDELRDELIPMNRRYPVGELLDAAYAYYRQSGRRVSIEYALIKDMNDHDFRARLLAKELNRRGSGWAHVNPIPLNPTPGSIWTASTRQQQESFVRILRERGITTTIRDTRGADIDGACGQLATEYARKHSHTN